MRRTDINQRKLVFLQWLIGLYSVPLVNVVAVPYTPELLRNSQASQMIRLGLCDLHSLHTRWCHASRIPKSRHKKNKKIRWWKPSALHSWQGGLREGGAAASHSFSCSVCGASAGSLAFAFLSSPSCSHCVALPRWNLPSLRLSPTRYGFPIQPSSLPGV